MTEKQIRDFQSGAIGAMKNIAALIAAIGVVFGAVFYMIEPRLDDWLADRETPILDRLDKIEARLGIISQSIRREQVALVDFEGVGYVPEKGKTFEPGEILGVIYHLRRNFSCKTRVHARFVSGSSGLSYGPANYEFIANQAPITEDLITFRVEVRIPENLPDGIWSYAPMIEAVEGCESLAQQAVPPSEFFIVKRS